MLLLAGWRSRALISLVCVRACRLRDSGIRARLSAREEARQAYQSQRGNKHLVFVFYGGFGTRSSSIGGFLMLYEGFLL